jgi:hypothetical protein
MKEVLNAKLEAALLRELAETWRELNGNHFRGQLRAPAFSLSTAIARLGQWDPRTRAISIHRGMILEQPWALVREVLKHEMAHQFVHEVLQRLDEPAHGPVFAAVCRDLGIDARAHGLPALPAEGGEGSPILRRITRLLALAGSANLHEAELAMSTAQKLMLKHNLEVAVAAAAEGYAFLQLGTPSQRVEGAEHILAGLLGRHFFVDPIWVPAYDVARGKSGRVLELVGTPSNLEVARYVHGFLLETAERLWREHQRQHGIAKNTERRRFQVGVMTGFDEKLSAAARDHRREGLIWVGDPRLEAYLKQRYPRRRSGTGVGVRPTQAYEQGRQAGRKIVLHKPVRGSLARGRLLGPAGP